jgi:hypothetical protein
MKKEFKITVALLSAYYVSVLLFMVLLKLSFIRDFVATAQIWLASVIKTASNANLESWYWVCLVLASFIVVFLIKKFIVEPLGLYVNDESSSGIPVFVLALIVLGCFLYYINTALTQPMPAYFPGFLVQLLGGDQNTYVDTNAAQENVFSIASIIWNIGPIVYLLFINQKYLKAKAA